MKDLILKGDIRSLAKAITLVESSRADHKIAAQKLINELLPHTGKSIRIGITGVPGAGKSTFIEALGLHLVDLKKKVAVLAIDPSSPISGGSILGDKTRMDRLSQSPMAFIRPTPTTGALGGVAYHTREAMLLCEAAGFEIIFIETIGVGESEYEVASMGDFFVLLQVPNTGDELQGIKKGILEKADLVIINKADGDNEKMAEIAKSHLQNAFSYISHEQFEVSVLTCSALKQIGFDKIWQNIQGLITKKNIPELRSNQNIDWFHRILQELFADHLNTSEKNWQKTEDKIRANEISPMQAAQKIFKQSIKE